MSGVGLGAGAWFGNIVSKAGFISGVYSMPDATSTFTVSGLDIGTTNYSIQLTVSNTVNVTVRHLVPVVTAKTSTSFSFVTNQTTDHPNYKAEYLILKL